MKPVKIARVILNNEIRYTIVEWNKLYELRGDLYGEFEKGDLLGRLQFDMLLSPVVPGTIYGLGINHEEYKAFLPKIGRNADVGDPVVFTKPTHSAVGMSERLIVPEQYKESGLKGSGELAVIIKYDCCNVTIDEAPKYILGYTNAFDAIPFNSYYVSDEEKCKAKGYPSFCPLGPYIVIGADPHDAVQRTYFNDLLILEGSLNGYVWDAYKTISELSKTATLKRNDVLILGACAPTREIQDTDASIFTKSNIIAGDTIIVETEGLGRLIIRAEDAK